MVSRSQFDSHTTPFKSAYVHSNCRKLADKFNRSNWLTVGHVQVAMFYTRFELTAVIGGNVLLYISNFFSLYIRLNNNFKNKKNNLIKVSTHILFLY